MSAGAAGIAIIGVDDIAIVVPGLGTFTGVDDDDTVFAAQAGAGIAYAISPSAILTLDYRFFATADPEINAAETEYRRHDIRVGVRFPFGPGR